METDTIIVYNLLESELATIKAIAANIKAKIYQADYFTDFLAIPSFYIIANPLDLTDEQLNTLFDYWQETEDVRVLFTHLIDTALVAKVLKMLTINDDAFFNPTMLKMELLQRKTKINNKYNVVRRYDIKVFRVLSILKKLQQNKFVYTRI